MAKRPKNDIPLDGEAVDSSGGPAIDPSLNVIALNQAASRRQDDLRIANNKWVDAEIRHLDEMALLRDQCSKDTANLRERHARDMATAEATRLNAIRQVDVLAVNTAADRAQAAIQTVALNTKAAEENLRQLVTTTAATLATSTANTIAGLTDRIAGLEKSSYEGKGRSTVADPQIAELISEMKNLRILSASTGGHKAGSDATWAWIITAITVGVASLGAVFTILKYAGG